MHDARMWDCTKLSVCNWELYLEKMCPWTHALQPIRQLRKHQPAIIFGCCTNSRKALHELDTFGISPVLPLPTTSPFIEARDIKPDFRVKSFWSKLYVQHYTRGYTRERSKPHCWTLMGLLLAL